MAEKQPCGTEIPRDIEHLIYEAFDHPQARKDAICAIGEMSAKLIDQGQFAVLARYLENERLSLAKLAAENKRTKNYRKIATFGPLAVTAVGTAISYWPFAWPFS